VVVETYVGVDLDDQQRFGRRVLDRVAGPNRDTGIRSGHGWPRCGGTNSAELAAGGQGRLINQYEAAA